MQDTNQAFIKRILQNLVAGHLVKKYKLLLKLGEETDISRNKRLKIMSKSVIVTKVSRFREVTKHGKNVTEFMERDDN